MAPAAGAFVIKCFQYARLWRPNSCFLISNYWKWKNCPKWSKHPVWYFKCCDVTSIGGLCNSQFPVQVTRGICHGMLSSKNPSFFFLYVVLNKADKSMTPGMWIYDMIYEMFLFIVCHGTLFNISNSDTELSSWN